MYGLLSHLLKVETGQWSRIPRENRVCKCGAGVQNENHVIVCPLVENERTFSKPCQTLSDTLNTTIEIENLCVYNYVT